MQHGRTDIREPALFDDAAPKAGPVLPMPRDPFLERMGRRLDRLVYLGTSSWNFPGWRGLVYAPVSGEKALAAEGLKAYAVHPIFRTVGIDRSFYRPLTAAQYAAFASQVPESFRFLVKAPQRVTDSVLRDERGRPTADNPDYLNAEAAEEQFLVPVFEGLADKSGPLVFEFSPLAACALRQESDRNRRIDEIVRFLEEMKARSRKLFDKDVLIASEMRSARLLNRRYMGALRTSGARPVVSIHPRMPSVMRQLEALRFMDAGENEAGDWTLKGDVVVRWSLAADATYSGLKAQWAPFDRIRRADILAREAVAALAERAVRSNVRAFVVANNKAEGCAPLTMRAIAESLTGCAQGQGDGPSIYPSMD